MFKFVCIVAFLCSVALTSNALETKPKVQGVVCEVCTLVLGAAQNLLEQNKTDAEVISFIEKNLCGRLGSLNATCVQYLEANGPEILYELANKINPSIVCHKMGLCAVEQVPKTIVFEAQTPKVKAGVICELCTVVLTAAKSLVKNNQSEEEILNFIETQLCARLGPLNGTCVQIIIEKGKVILDALLNGTAPADVCKDIALCDAKPVEFKPLDKLANVKAGIICELCTVVLTAAKSLVKNNQSEEEVLNFIETQLCARLGPLNGTCVQVLLERGKEILDALLNGTAPGDVCKDIALCSAQISKIDTVKQISLDKRSTNVDSGILCELCTTVLTAAKGLVANNQSEEKVIEFIEKQLCGRLGPLNATCTSILEDFAGTLIIELNNTDPAVLCKRFGLCSSSSKPLLNKSKFLNALVKRDIKTVKSGPECELCTIVLTAAKSLLSSNQSDEQVLSFLEKNLCDRLGPLSGICVKYLETQGKQVLYDLGHNVDPTEVCTDFGLCTAQQRLVSDPNPIVCGACQYIVQFVEAEVGGNKTEAAIVKALESVCKLAPSSLQEKCDNIVETYGTYLVQLILQFSDPLKVCQSLKLC